ncbi:hypothetical protein SmJEL517_g01553 [Synchytrium microbalum]|uniref:Large ribosomal subunit protein mL45 n=1 Tax=Synchytrium microbalum TaxID=1806994 RepID=A0A507CE97_9FUNG|nr:uncharacterized protein SmJEL517_g01553 [Synchytrium microbalum]TPX36366.1 hypothetical protein SmJEL517_g01553 [Synchytrium microbalum]
MNEDFAAYNFESLCKVLSPPMQNAMQSEIAKLKQMGKMEWKSHGQSSKTKILHAVMGKTPAQTQDIYQFTMELNYNQAVALYREKKNGQKELVAGDPNKIVPIREYIVFERIISYKDNSRKPEVKSYGHWRIAGKLEYKPKEGKAAKTIQ